MLLYITLLVVLLAIIFYTTVTGRSGYQEIVQARDTKARQKVYRRWISESWLLFGVPSVAAFLALSYTQGIVAADITLPLSRGSALGFAVGIGVVLIALVIHSAWYATRISATKRDEIKKLIDTSGSGGLVAQNKAERRLALWLSVAAGVTEEVLFRALLPVLLINIFGAEWSILAVGVSVALFGIAHAYQGLTGIVTTGIIGAIFMLIFLGTGSLALVIGIHILLDIRATVGTSWLLYGKNKTALK